MIHNRYQIVRYTRMPQDTSILHRETDPWHHTEAKSSNITSSLPKKKRSPCFYYAIPCCISFQSNLRLIDSDLFNEHNKHCLATHTYMCSKHLLHAVTAQIHIFSHKVLLRQFIRLHLASIPSLHNIQSSFTVAAGSNQTVYSRSIRHLRAGSSQSSTEMPTG